MTSTPPTLAERKAIEERDEADEAEYKEHLGYRWSHKHYAAHSDRAALLAALKEAEEQRGPTIWQNAANELTCKAETDRANAAEADLKLAQARIDGLEGALRYILAFYEPGQPYLDTNAWEDAEASARALLATSISMETKP